jgi:hypothetical protein
VFISLRSLPTGTANLVSSYRKMSLFWLEKRALILNY